MTQRARIQEEADQSVYSENVGPESQDEIDKIMSEIQSLQKEMDTNSDLSADMEASGTGQTGTSSGPATTQKPKLAVVSPEGEKRHSDSTFKDHEPQFLDSGPFDKLSKDIQKSIQPSLEQVPDRMESSTPQLLTIGVQGMMALRLNYGNEKNYLEIHFSENSVNIQTADGTEIRLPTSPRNRKKVA